MTQPPMGPWGQYPQQPPRRGPFPPPMPVAPPPMARPLPPQWTPQLGQPYGPPRFGMYPPPMPPKKTNAGLVVVVVVAALAISTALYVGLSSGRKNKSRHQDVGYSPTTHSAPYTTTSRPTRTTTTTTRTTTASRPTTTTTTRTTTTTTTPAGPQPVYSVDKNPLYSTTNGTNVVTCNLPAWRSDPGSAAAYFNAAMPCLEQAWAPAMARANLPYRPPTVEFPAGESWTSPCGGYTKAQAPAFYCSRNETIYMPFAGLYTERFGNQSGGYLALFAHEYGHHVQYLSGVMDTYGELRYDAGDQTVAGLEMSRRFELQASCLGGMWFAGVQNGGGSITDKIIREMLADGYNRGDWEGRTRDHGTPQHNGGWQEQGFTTNRTYQCNTWVMASEHVS